MTTPAYPATIPGPTRVSFRPGVQLVSSADELGPVAVRRRSRQPTADAQVSFVYLEDDYATFVAWWRDTLLYGHRWFTLALPSANGLVDHVVRFARKYSAQVRGHRYVDVSCDLEVRERKIGTETILVPVLSYELDLVAPGWPGGNCASAFVPPPKSVHFEADPAMTYEITLPAGRLYTAWSGYPTDSIPEPWIVTLSWRQVNGATFNDVLVTPNNSVSGVTPEEARAGWVPLYITGYTDYYFWLNDPNPTDNRGGLSLLLTEVP